jgi:MoaA/NifB/PqqE/SkfB family radical SAM enzyme/GT2 family glycosyltransferase
MSQEPICKRPWTGFELVDHLGDVRPCCWGKVSCGNINEAAPAEIWNGSGFQFYRDQMLANNLEPICNPSCPIIQQQYKEFCPPATDETILEPDSNHCPSAPVYLRVVPTTKCNLHCPMCYQADSPPTRLPESLFESLDPWMRGACELLILGGETFLTRECLSWIERINPEHYPDCRLAAITNGLGFSDKTCELISHRKWSWILVSIDAASAPVYKAVRGGEFDKVLTGLQRICETRAIQPFELRMGFTLQNSNLADAVQFVDLCADFDATPQFTLVAGDWHGEGPRSDAEINACFATLELVDKRLAERGFSNAIISSALTSLRMRSKTPPLDYKQSAAVVRPYAARTGSGRRLIKSWPSLELHDAKDHIHIEVRGTLVRDLEPSVANEIARLKARPIVIEIPFFRRKSAVSAFDVQDTVQWLRDVADRESWGEIVPQLDLTALGHDPTDCSPFVETVARFGEQKAVDLAVISPIFNRASLLPWFLASILPQVADHFELILVDDGSTDDSLKAALEIIKNLRIKPNVTVLKCHRKKPYQKGTFTFGAGVARQAAVTKSTAKKLVFIDPDQLVARDCLNEHNFWLEQGFPVVLGDRRDCEPDIGTEWRSIRTEALSCRPNWWMSFCTANAAVNRASFDAVGGFDPSLQYWGLDDTDLGYRLYRTGMPVWHTLRCSVVHLDPEGSGAGETSEDRLLSYRLHMEVLYRKYLDSEIIAAFDFLQ